MKRKSYGRDFGLSSRMFLTMFTLGLLYIVFFVVMVNVLNVGIFAVVLIMGVLAFVQYFTSDKIALLASGAKVVEPDEEPELHAMVERLAAMADRPKPRVALIPNDMPNAFATGRNQKHAVVAVTQGLLSRLEPQEIEGVLAHELTHVANRDVAVMTIASFFSMVAAMLARFGLWGGMFSGGDRDRNSGAPVWLIMFAVSLLTYVISWVLIMMISRYREYAADRGSALITGAPEHLMSALQKIASRMTQIPQQELLDSVAQEAHSKVERRGDEFGFEWLIVRDNDFEELVAGVHLVASELAAHGFGEQLLAAAFKFKGAEHPVYFIYGFKRGAWWPFVPTGDGKGRDNSEALELKAKLEKE